jgi:hypothetical protein
VTPLALVFGNFRLCDGCSKGLHLDHIPVNCQCDLCTKEPA